LSNACDISKGQRSLVVDIKYLPKANKQPTCKCRLLSF